MTARFKVVFSDRANDDLRTIGRHLLRSYADLGYSQAEAFKLLERSLKRIADATQRLALAPYQGTLMPEIMTDLRCVTKERAIFYFRVIEDVQTVEVLAIFYGGQDHISQIAERLSPRN